MITGIVPAAGTGSRWGGYFKELLPTQDGEFLLDRAVSVCREGGADRIVLVSSPSKLTAHKVHLHPNDTDVIYTLQKSNKDIYGAIEDSFVYNTETNLFIMPDTYTNINAFYGVDKVLRETRAGFLLGIHKTNRPERFGVIDYNSKKVVNKQVLPEGTYDAWGVMAWTREVTDFWIRNDIENYTDAINYAIYEFGLNTFDLAYYYDMANMESYLSFLEDRNGKIQKYS